MGLELPPADALGDGRPGEDWLELELLELELELLELELELLVLELELDEEDGIDGMLLELLELLDD